MKTPPSISLPDGTRDILPEEAEKIAAIESRIKEVLKGYGFKRVITPLLEYVDVLSLGLGDALKEKILKFIDPSTGKVMAIRPDITPQIARVVSAKMRDYPLPIKLYYNENVVRSLGERGAGRKELLQIGAEYVSKEASPEIDAEMIIIAIEAMKAAGIASFKLDVGDVGFVKKILNRLPLDEKEKTRLREFIAKKDASGIARLLKGFGRKVSNRDKTLLTLLTASYGEAEALKKMTGFLKDSQLKGSLDYLKNVITIISGRGYKGFLTIDLGEARGFDYYTGIIFEGFVTKVEAPAPLGRVSAGRAVLSGGRYDTLLAKYGYDAASTGFAFDVETIASVSGAGRGI